MVRTGNLIPAKMRPHRFAVRAGFDPRLIEFLVQQGRIRVDQRGHLHWHQALVPVRWALRQRGAAA
jgi:hypothetical protein